MAENKEQGMQDINELLKVRRNKLADLVERGKDPFVITKYDVTAHSDEIKNNVSKYAEDEEVSIAGRIMSKRIMGKLLFAMWQTGWGLFRHMCSAMRLAKKNIRILRNMT